MRALLLAALVVTHLSVAGCSKPSSVPAPGPASSAAPAGPVAESDGFRAELDAKGPFKKGEPGTFVVRVTAKAPFHVNAEYPAKFKAAEAPGLKYAEAKLERTKHAEAFAVEPCAAGKDACVLNITVRFTPEASGTVHVGGVLDVSVCNKDQCLIDKKSLDVTVTVS